ncbi:MAG: hypothetical protein HY696_03855 [Deltaproteobacteria bacterium]|nr:hypothetical protein [Deltaproteobacteria bacterium]
MNTPGLKGVTVIPAGSTYGKAKAVDQTPSATDQHLQDIFQRMETEASQASGIDAAADPLLALRAALEGTTIPTTEYPVPSVEELVAKFPTLNFFADGQIEAQFEALKFEYAKQAADLEGQLKNAALTPTQQRTVRAQYESLQQALIQIDQEIAGTREVAAKAQQTYAQEIALLKKVGLEEITPEEADLNGDGKIGNGEFILGTRTLEGETEVAILDAKTMKPIKFDADGNPMGANVLNPKYEYDLQQSGLKFPTELLPNKDTTGADLVLQAKGEYLGARKSYDGSDNTYNAHIDIPIPEAIWVETYANGEVKSTLKNGETHLTAANTSLLMSPPTDASHYKQIKITTAEISSVTSEPPLSWNNSGTTTWKKEYGTDQLVKFRDADGNVVLQLRITGYGTKGQGQDTPFEGVNYVTASSLSLAVSSGSGTFGNDKNKIRTSPVEVNFASNYVSTGTGGQFNFAAAQEFDHSHNDDANQITDSKQRALLKTMQSLGLWTPSDLQRGYLGTQGGFHDYLTGAYIVGLRGNIKGTNYNDAIDVAPPPDTVDPEDPEYTTTIDGGGGYNAIFGKHGNHYVQGATFVEITGRDGDVNHIGTKGEVTWANSHQDAATQEWVKESWADNPSVYVRVDTPGANSVTVLGNPEEAKADGFDKWINVDVPTTDELKTDPKAVAKKHANDFYAINSGSFNAYNQRDLDLLGAGLDDNPLSSAHKDDILEIYQEKRKKVVEAIQAKEEEIEAGSATAEVEAWQEYGPLYTEAQEEMSGFFAAYAQHEGIAPTNDGLGAKQTDVAKTFGA